MPALIKSASRSGVERGREGRAADHTGSCAEPLTCVAYGWGGGVLANPPVVSERLRARMAATRRAGAEGQQSFLLHSSTYAEMAC